MLKKSICLLFLLALCIVPLLLGITETILPGRTLAPAVCAPSGELPQLQTAVSSDAAAPRYLLYDGDEITISLLPALDISSGQPDWFAEVTNTGSRLLYVAFSDVVFNDRYPGTFLLSLAPNYAFPVKAQSSLQISLNTFRIEEEITKVSCSVHIFSDETYTDTIDEQSVQAEFPAAQLYTFQFVPMLGARADQQILCENEDITVTLYGCGICANSFLAEDLDFLLRFDNRSGKPIPFCVMGACVNGQWLEPDDTSLIFHSSDYLVQPGMSRTERFSLLAEDLDDYGIDSIATLSLLILTSDEENTDATGMNFVGGTLYPVSLAQHGTAQVIPSGEVLYEDDYVRLSLFTPLTEEDEKQGWLLYAENLSDTHLSFALSSFAEKTDAVFDSWGGTTRLPAHSSGYFAVYLKEGIPLQSVDFELSVLSMGGDLILEEYLPFTLPG